MDPEAERIVKDFTSILEELTFNSRPIITTITKIAEENISYSQYFVDALENRIDKCVPGQKLYAFYAVDSICKNAGSPYTIYFSRNLFSLYKKTYLLVDNNTRSKLINMFKTWMTPNEATGGPLFEGAALERIEKFLIKASALHQKNFQLKLPTPTVPLLLRDIDKLTVLTNERLRNLPNDEKLLMKLNVLSQLKQSLQREKLSQDALRQVQLQLKQIFAQDQKVIQDSVRRQQQQNEQGESKQSSKDHTMENGSKETGSYNNNVHSESSTPFSPLFSSSSGSTPPVSSTLFGNISSFLPAQNFAEIERSNKISSLNKLYESLNEEGLLYEPPKESVVTLYNKLNKDSELSSINDTVKNLPPISTLQNILFDCKAYFSTVNINVSNIPSLQFNQQNIANKNPLVTNSLINLLYRVKSNKCSTCGKRFGNAPEEKKLYNEHLDWHFRINNRIKGSSVSSTSASLAAAANKNIQSRNWYLSALEWINFKDDFIVSTKEVVDEDRQTNSQNNRAGIVTLPSGGKISSATGSNVSEESLYNKFVAVPESSVDMTFKCPICKDVVSSVYDEESGEWIWKNTVSIDGKYFHATCYHETSKNSR
ncbi:hypothetical protein KAFR_0E02660 [Kazachstania africana CBS 2517]|uniref:CID domain-containing protein n=1 Tax=Kazachstania africana (strain ATCC 22294 / BCRC 22015 / CBS 2517 / CECT 1963 / NBRC 1671 / NRRL Y-8276) TaxID=1071382 RepID=H2AVL8_KAZAF|nr:hypothetical protein KAFR_0E02660 [Kazachstania africana CBS 2517]CCF58418.1 hypothetical protein KAFR_0E02660 [Kazachstania africana CBS 2517]